MAVALEFIDFIVPINIIEKKYPGGWKSCLRDHVHLIGGNMWYDDHLFRGGAMSPADIKIIADWWAGKGLDLFCDVDGKRHWKDACVTQGLYGESTLPCEWIAFLPNEDMTYFSAYLKGYPPGKIIGREHYKNLY